MNTEYMKNFPTRFFEPFTNKHQEWANGHKIIADMLCARKGYIVMLYGIRGTGKTRMAVSIAKLYAQKEMRATYCKAIDIFMAIRGTYNGNNKDESEAISEFIIPSLLVIDEAQERGNSDWEDRLLTYIIDKRYDALKDTILISNQIKQEFVKSVGQSIASRILETGAVIECKWESFRTG